MLSSNILCTNILAPKSTSSIPLKTWNRTASYDVSDNVTTEIMGFTGMRPCAVDLTNIVIGAVSETAVDVVSTMWLRLWLTSWNSMQWMMTKKRTEGRWKDSVGRINDCASSQY